MVLIPSALIAHCPSDPMIKSRDLSHKKYGLLHWSISFCNISSEVDGILLRSISLWTFTLENAHRLSYVEIVFEVK